jgi:archaellum biogenesis protein FlaJ (TadC family)
MSKVITATVTFEYLVEEDELMRDLSNDEQIEYVRETTLEDIREMAMEYSDQLADAIDIQIKNV